MQGKWFSSAIFLGPQMLLHRDGEVGAALHRRIVADDQAFPAFHPANARDDPGGRRAHRHTCRGRPARRPPGRRCPGSSRRSTRSRGSSLPRSDMALARGLQARQARLWTCAPATLRAGVPWRPCSRQSAAPPRRDWISGRAFSLPSEVSGRLSCLWGRCHARVTGFYQTGRESPLGKAAADAHVQEHEAGSHDHP